ncbi:MULTISPECIES: transporter substrate-binding domain-containing protein [unclassified Moorena]|uniref:transporter substrate-binding domain-containing protein n=1 Tax=unclassified Moorena TaxID=2683338 RepID=UPI0013CC3580|nr:MULTISPECIES: transporter substrate-binding domain-containing protein [unclassified Moorena]NEO23253.1 transporter substrate-binding domain-containing protein [Moorena sp. SIO4A5]NEQ61153.1 transporter substrate-binding domain-containing protein [Moorena sp. SIO4A1]
MLNTIKSRPRNANQNLSQVNRGYLKFITILLSIAAITFFDYPSAAQTNQEKDILNLFIEEENPKLIVRIRTSSYPISTGYEDPKLNFCYGFAVKLVKKLNNDFRLNKEPITLDPIFNNNLENPRFESVREGIVHLQCGPDTRKQKYYFNNDGVIFSNHFLTTGIRILVNKSKIKNLKSLPKDLNIGVTVNTTTIKEIEPLNPKIFETREEGIRALAQGDIDAFASDDILLQGYLKKDKNFKPSKYVLYPRDRYLSEFKSEDYAMVIKEGNYKFKEYINELIKDEKEKLDKRLTKEGFVLFNKISANPTKLPYIAFTSLLLSVISLLVYLFYSRITIFEYSESEFDFVIFLYTLKQLKFNQEISVTVHKHKHNDQNEKIFRVELSLPFMGNKARFKRDIFENYYKNKNNIDIKELIKDNKDFQSIIDSTNKLLKLDSNKFDNIYMNLHLHVKNFNAPVGSVGNRGTQKNVSGSNKVN